MYYHTIPEDVKEQYRYAIEQSRKDRDRYLAWINEKIDEVITLIASYDMIYVLGGLGAKSIKATPTAYNQFLAKYEGEIPEEVEENMLQEDDEIEVLLEYAMNIATALENQNTGIIPTAEQLDEIYEKLSAIKSNVNFWELSAENPTGGNEFDHWLRTNIMLESINVRGNGYSRHIYEVYKELFTPHNGFLDAIYGFNADDLLNAILRLDMLVFSKVGNPQGSVFAHQRLTEWLDKVGDAYTREQLNKGTHFLKAFTNENPDLYNSGFPDGIAAIHLDNVSEYNRMFWVIPETAKEKLIYKCLSQQFGDNKQFFIPTKFKAFPLNDTNIKLKPLIFSGDKYYCYSLTLAYRNIFKITEELIKKADGAYYENRYQGNAYVECKDNYIERKAVSLLQRLLPHAQFYHSLEYNVHENGMNKRPELDILGVSGDTAYIIEVKAGELNTKHRRGAMQGLKDRLEETINEGSYQCHRALNYILNNATPSFDYAEGGTNHTLTIDKTAIQTFYKISVTFEHFSSISANLSYLINTGVLSADYKWTWIVSLYDLMVFADIIASEADFKDYIRYRIELYDREDITFNDEVDILGFFLDGQFPLDAPKENYQNTIVGFSKGIDDYYTAQEVTGQRIDKPQRKQRS